MKHKLHVFVLCTMLRSIIFHCSFFSDENSGEPEDLCMPLGNLMLVFLVVSMMNAEVGIFIWNASISILLYNGLQFGEKRLGWGVRGGVRWWILKGYNRKQLFPSLAIYVAYILFQRNWKFCSIKPERKCERGRKRRNKKLMHKQDSFL